MIIFKYLPKMNYTKADNNVIKHPSLSAGAKILYLALCGYKDGRNKWEKKVQEELGLSRATYFRQKKELEEVGLVKMVQKGPKEYVMYIGNSDRNAADVEQMIAIEGSR